MESLVGSHPPLMALLSHLSVNDISRLCMVSPAFRIICEDSMFWIDKVKNEDLPLFNRLIANNVNPLIAFYITSDSYDGSYDLYYRSKPSVFDMIELGYKINPQIVVDAIYEGDDAFVHRILENTALRLTFKPRSELLPEVFIYTALTGDLVALSGSGDDDRGHYLTGPESVAVNDIRNVLDVVSGIDMDIMTKSELKQLISGRNVFAGRSMFDYVDKLSSLLQ